MHFRVTLKIIGMLLMAFSTSMLPSLIIALSLPDDSSESTFALSFCITFVAGFLVVFFRGLPLRGFDFIGLSVINLNNVMCNSLPR